MRSMKLGLRDSKVLVLLVMEEATRTLGKEAIGARKGGRGAAKRMLGLWAGKVKISIARVGMLISTDHRVGLSLRRKGAR
jgi:hypothetical protein